MHVPAGQRDAAGSRRLIARHPRSSSKRRENVGSQPKTLGKRRGHPPLRNSETIACEDRPPSSESKSRPRPAGPFRMNRPTPRAANSSARAGRSATRAASRPRPRVLRCSCPWERMLGATGAHSSTTSRQRPKMPTTSCTRTDSSSVVQLFTGPTCFCPSSNLGSPNQFRGFAPRSGSTSEFMRTSFETCSLMANSPPPARTRITVARSATR